MEFKNIFISMMVVAVLVFSILNWVIITQTDNNQEYLITNNTIINRSFGNLQGNLSSTRTESDTASLNFGNVTPSQNFGIVDVSSVISPTRIFKALTIGTFNILIELPIKILGFPPIIAGVITAIVFLLIILSIWAIWRGVGS